MDTCKWYVSIDKPECGAKAVAKVKVGGKVTQATVDLCTDHKAEHDRRFAAIRASKATVSK